MANYGIQFKDKNGNKYYPCPFPIGFVVLTTSKVNPQTYWGGTWVQMYGGYLYACQNTAGQTSYTGWGTQGHAITTSQMPSHNHSQNAHMHWVCDRHSDGRHIRAVGWYGWAGGSALPVHCGTGASQCDANVYGMLADYTTATNNPTGGGAAHSHNIASVDVFAWKRTA